MKHFILPLIIAVLAPAPVQGVEPAVKVHLLDLPAFHASPREGGAAREDARKKAADKRPKFWIDWSEAWLPIARTETVTGRKALDLIELMRRELPEKEALDFCGHSPAYGIEALRPDGSKFTTSLCFDCGTWVQPKKRYRMNDTGIRCELALALRAIIELPQPVLDADTARKAKAEAAARKRQEEGQGKKKAKS